MARVPIKLGTSIRKRIVDILMDENKFFLSGCLSQMLVELHIGYFDQISGTFGSRAILFMLGIIKRRSTKQANEDPDNTLTIS